MAKLADAADLKSAGPKGLWGFDSPSRHQHFWGRSVGVVNYILPWDSGSVSQAEGIRPWTDAYPSGSTFVSARSAATENLPGKTGKSNSIG